MKHFILTRFMMHVGLSKEKNQNYVDSRIIPFNNFYVKSMIAQSNKDFVNVFFIDPKYSHFDYSKFHFDKLNCKIIYISKFTEIKDALKKNFNIKDNDFVLTTRMDSDDMIQKDFVKGIQNSAKQADSDCIVDFKKIIMMSIDDKSYRVRSYTANSMFLSTKTKLKNFEKFGCYSGKHGQLHERFKKKVVLNGVGGGCICHKNNILNTVGGKKEKVNISDLFPWV